MFDPTLLVAATKSVTLTFGGILTFFSFRAYRRTRAPALRALAIGIGLVTAGAILGGALHQTGVLSLELAVSVKSAFTAAGFGLLTYSLYAEGAARPFAQRIRRAAGGDGATDGDGPTGRT